MAVEGRIQTRQWEDDSKQRHWKTEIVASAVEMLAGKRKKDYATESAASALETQANELGISPAAFANGDEDDESEIDDEPESASADTTEHELVAA